jgi:hypothetical protein
MTAGSKIAHYKLTTKLGEGSMRVVQKRAGEPFDRRPPERRTAATPRRPTMAGCSTKSLPISYRNR